MTDPTLVRGPWRGAGAQFTTGTGPGWRPMWTHAADLLHQELLAAGWDEAPSVACAISDAADTLRQELPTESHDALIEACFVFSVWLDRYAPNQGLRGLEHMLELRAAARWGDG